MAANSTNQRQRGQEERNMHQLTERSTTKDTYTSG